MSHDITITSGQAVSDYGLNIRRGFTIVSREQISREDVEKVQRIAGTWVELTFAREALTLPVQKNRIEKFKDYVLWKPLDQWQDEAEYDLFLSAIQRLVRAEEAYTKMRRDYQVLSIRFGAEPVLAFSS